MRVYLKQRGCPKCGCADTYDRYHEGDKEWPATWERDLACKAERIGEHIDRNCRRCGYKWVEACLPAKATP